MSNVPFHVELCHGEQKPERKKPRRRAGTCCVCKDRERRPGQATCRKCHAENMREYRRREKERIARLEQIARETGNAAVI